MLNQLLRVASAAGSYAATADNIGDSASHLATRRITNNILDSRSHPSAAAESHIEAFRGTVYAAVDKIARRVAQLPMRLKQCEHNIQKDEIEETVVNFHPYMTLFSDANGHRPHEEYSVWELKYILQVSLDMTGEGWWLVERDFMGRPSRVTPLPANRMTIVFREDTGTVAGHFFTPKGTTINTKGSIFIPKYDWKYLQSPAGLTTPYVVFFRYPSLRGIEDPRGWSPMKAAAFAYDINLFEQIYKKNFLLQGAQLGGILQSEVALSKDQIEDYLDQFKARHSGPKHAGLPMVLPKMLKWTTTEPSPRDMQWAEAVNLTDSKLLQIYGISDAKLGRADIGNRNTADAMDVTFNREVIQTRVDLINAKINTEFLPIYPGQSDKLYFASGFDDPVPGDGEMALKREDQDIKNSIITRNELRASRRLKPFAKFGDQQWMPINMLPTDPWAATVDITHDDADKLGFVDPAEQAKLDQQTAEAQSKLDAKNNPQDDKKNNNGNGGKDNKAK